MDDVRTDTQQQLATEPSPSSTLVSPLAPSSAPVASPPPNASEPAAAKTPQKTAAARSPKSAAAKSTPTSNSKPKPKRDPSQPSIFDKLTDPSKYTGAHKSRFDSAGKGTGKARVQAERENPSQGLHAVVSSRSQVSPSGSTSSNASVSSAEKRAKAKRDSSQPSIFDKLTDPSKYTGAHKSRFDSEGKGTGKERVREELQDPSRGLQTIVGARSRPANSASPKGTDTSKPKPKRSPRDPSKPSIFDKLTDPTKYTGSHRARFSGDGTSTSPGNHANGVTSPASGTPLRGAQTKAAVAKRSSPSVRSQTSTSVRQPSSKPSPKTNGSSVASTPSSMASTHDVASVVSSDVQNSGVESLGVITGTADSSLTELAISVNETPGLVHEGASNDTTSALGALAGSDSPVRASVPQTSAGSASEARTTGSENANLIAFDETS